MRKRGILSVLLIVLLAAVGRSQQYEVTVKTITVWVKAVDSSGKPVEGLKKEDFAVYEDDKPMPLTCFEEMKTMSGQAAATPEAQQIPAAKFIIFLDLFNTTQFELLYIKPKLQQFLDQVKASGRQVMVAALLPNRKMGVVVPFTSDVHRVKEVLEQAQGSATRDTGTTDRENQVLQAIQGAGSGRGLEDKLRGAYQLADNLSRQDRELTLFTLKAFESFAGFLSKSILLDRGVMLLISGGFSADPGRRYFDIVDKAVEEIREQIENPDQTIFRRPTNFDIRKEIQKSIGRFNRHNLTVYTINTRGLILTDVNVAQRPSEIRDTTRAADYQDALVQVAQETGGVSFYNSNNFKLGFNNVLQDINHQYLLCYNAPDHKKSGVYHPIKVTLKTPGVVIRYRAGYMD
jgi:VWFA-related protein